MWSPWHLPVNFAEIKMLLTNSLATLAVVSPVWLPWLQKVSTFSAMLMPILGAFWLITQIYQAWVKKKANKL